VRHVVRLYAGVARKVTKQHIIDEIRRTAKANGGAPLGHKRFELETGIGYYDWWGQHWGRWSDAVRDAGFPPNAFLQDAFSDDEMLEKLIALIRELGRFPATGDLRLKKRSDSSFPNDKVFARHFGSRSKLREMVVKYCRSHNGFEDIPNLCGLIATNDDEESVITEKPATDIVGFVYLMKHGRHFKIGKTNATGRREYELAIQLPEKLQTVHIIKTDDPGGIEDYWHKRFAAKRGNGEWFALDSADVMAFKRRKFM
jgi:hypothetical protein